MVSELAGKPAPKELLIDVDQLNKAYYEKYPDMTDSSVQVCFGTSGHRGTPQNGSFTEAHVRAITQAVLDYRTHVGAAEVLYVGMDTHAISAAAQKTVLEVLAGNGIQTLYQQDGDFTPTPVISHAILSENRRHGANYSDGIIITPS
ncbi:MAG: hypothetical protein IKW74_05355, partial [Thermoguttaceae bacterium]|nr:hypothetical protein [Thermoguttaceae bacterium]